MMTDEELAPHLLRLRLIWFAIGQAVFVYAAIVWFVDSGRETARELPPVVPNVFAAAGIGASLMSFAVKRIMLSPERVGAATRDLTREQALAALTSGLLIVWATADACAIMGLVVGLISDRTTLAYILIFGGAAFVFAHVPSAGLVRDFVSAAEIASQRRQTE